MNKTESQKIFLRSMIDASKIQTVNSENPSGDFFIKLLGQTKQKKEMHPRTKKAIDRIAENLKREGILELR